MPSQAMQNGMDDLRAQRAASAGQAPPPLAERRATFAPAGRPHPVPDDVAVTDVTAGRAPGAGWFLLSLGGGCFEFGSLRSDGELAARLGRAGGMRVLFPEYRLAPEQPLPAAIDDVIAAYRGVRPGQGM